MLAPAWVFAPSNKYPDIEGNELIIIQGNSLGSITNSTIVSSKGVLTSLNGKEDIGHLVKQKYPEMADLLVDLAKCEATWQHDGLWGDNYQSYGIYQFQKKTFYDYCPSSWNWQDAEDQLDCAVIMIKQGLGPTTIGWFNCWKMMGLDKYLEKSYN